jgi:hypothetical protein
VIFLPSRALLGYRGRDDARRESREDGVSFRRLESCRVCGGGPLKPFLDLGETPLANSFLTKERLGAAEPRYPLALVFCGGCALVSLSGVVDPEVMFRDYLYVSGTSDTMPRHFAELGTEVVDRFVGTPGGLVVEIGSNDGTLLRAVNGRGARVLGVEPATNIAAIAERAGVPTVNDFFSARLARTLRAKHGPARAVLANNVVAHVHDVRDLVAGVHDLLDADGVMVMEAPYLVDLLDHVEYDTVYHEHLSYFAFAPLVRLMANAGLHVFDVRRVAVHGGSLRVYASRDPRPAAAEVGRLRAVERERRLETLAPYEAFADRVRAQRASLVALLRRLRSGGKRVVGYGAPAKGNTMLNYCEIDTTLLDYTVDKNPLKQGMFTPGMRLSVRPVETLLTDQPDYALLLAWNFADEILRQQASYREGGGQFIHPLPEPRIL